jgi:ABC-type multidrug transport system fused ATPase/permease subunit
MALWIAPNGPLVNGTVEANLWPDGHSDATVDLMEIARKAKVSEAILNLADGLQTLVSPGDERMQPDQLFRMGVARGLVRKRSVVVAEEPRSRGRPTTENETLEALQQLTAEGAIVVVLPNRPGTLRMADQVIVLHEHRIAATGTHAQLLEQSELYRHLNYLRFTVIGQT